MAAREPRRSRIWWLIGGAILAAVIIAAVRRSEPAELARILRHAAPGWVLGALVLQGLTYWAQGESWRGPVAAAGRALSSSAAYRLALAKLFVDQALPSGGISGALVVQDALRRRAVPAAAASAAVVVDTIGSYAAYLVCLGGALVFFVAGGHHVALVSAAAALFAVFAIAVCGLLLALSGRPPRSPRWRRVAVVRHIVDAVAAADPALVRRPRLLLRSTGCQLLVISLDASTLGVLLRSLGAHAAPRGVFASFMLSSLLRTIGVVPGGLGTFEAASVLTLHGMGTSVAASLSATLLFRAVSFWLPMLPGVLSARGLRRARKVFVG